MPIEINEKFEQRLLKARMIWLTTVDKYGVPQPVPVWFLWENGTFLIYTQPSAPKVRNIARNPQVTLHLNSEDEWGEEYVVIFGDAVIDENQPPSNQVPAYLEKHLEGILNIPMTPESVAESFSMAIRVTPTRIRGA